MTSSNNQYTCILLLFTITKCSFACFKLDLQCTLIFQSFKIKLKERDFGKKATISY